MHLVQQHLSLTELAWRGCFLTYRSRLNMPITSSHPTILVYRKVALWKSSVRVCLFVATLLAVLIARVSPLACKCILMVGEIATFTIKIGTDSSNFANHQRVGFKQTITSNQMNWLRFARHKHPWNGGRTNDWLDLPPVRNFDPDSRDNTFRVRRFSEIANYQAVGSVNSSIRRRNALHRRRLFPQF